MSNSKNLTPKQERFVQEYLIDFNATQAYKRAGYSASNDVVAATEGFKLLRNPKIIKALEEAKKKEQNAPESPKILSLTDLKRLLQSVWSLVIGTHGGLAKH